MINRNSQYFRTLGWEQLRGRWESPVLFTLVYMVISIFVSLLFSALHGFLLLPVQYSFCVAFLNDKRTASGYNIESLIDGYKDFARVMGTLLLVSVYTFLWSLLLIVPGIIKSISYSQTSFILKDNPELAYNEAIERSMAMMEGYKMRYFLLQLSFIGWILLCVLTCGILNLWVVPYMTATNVHFYEFVKEEYEKRITA